VTKLTAFLLGTLSLLALSYSALAPSFNPLINWLGPVLNVPFQFLLGLAFAMFGNPTAFPAVFFVWVAVGVAIGLLVRRTGGAVLSAFLAYAAGWVFLIVSGAIVFSHLFPLGPVSALSTLSTRVPTPPAPPGTSIATILNEPMLDGLPALFAAVTSGGGALSSISEDWLLILLSAGANFVTPLFVAGLTGSISRKASKRGLQSLNARRNRPTPKATVVLALVLLLSPAGAPLAGSLRPPSTVAATTPNHQTGVMPLSPTYDPPSPLSVVGAEIAPPPSTSVTIAGASPSFFCSLATLGQCDTWYFYAAANDGSSPVTQSVFSFAQDYNVTDGEDHQSVIFGYSQTSNKGTVSADSSSSPTIGGIAIRGSADGDNPYPFQLFSFENTGQGFITGTFDLSQTSFVVLVAGASNTAQTPTVSLVPDASSLVVDAVSSTSGGGTLVFADSPSLAPRNYTFSMQFFPGSDSSQVAIGVQLYVFPLSVQSGTIVGILADSGPESGGTQATVLGVGFNGAKGVQFAPAAGPVQGCGVYLVSPCHVDTDSELTVSTPAWSAAGAWNVNVVLSDGSLSSASCPVSTPKGAPDCSQFAYYPQTATLSNSATIGPVGNLSAIRFDQNVTFKEGTLWVNASLGATAQVNAGDASVTWVNGELESARFAVTLTEQASLSFTAEKAVSGPSLIVPLPETTIDVIPLGVVPLFVNLDPTFNITSGVNAQMSVNVTQGVQYKFTLIYNAQASPPLSLPPSTPTCTNGASPQDGCLSESVSADLSGFINASLGLGISFRVFDLAGFAISPVLSAELYAQAGLVNPTGTCGGVDEGSSLNTWWSLCARLDLDVSADLDTFGLGQPELGSIEVASGLLAASCSIGMSSGPIGTYPSSELCAIGTIDSFREAEIIGSSPVQLYVYMAGTISSSSWPVQPTWTVSSPTGCGSISASGLYSPPSVAAKCEIEATFTPALVYLDSNPITVDVSVSPSGTPVVESVTPNVGLGDGSTSVSIRGIGFSKAMAVDFGENNPSTNFNIVNDSLIQAFAPTGAGIVDVTVTTATATSSATQADQFTYVSVSGFSPTSGPVSGGTTVTISGSGFAAPLTVLFGTTEASSIDLVSSTTVTAVTPAGSGTVPITVEEGALGNLPFEGSDEFTYGLGIPSPYYLESILSEINPDGSATTFYSFLTNSATQNPLFSPGSGEAFMLLISQSGGVTLLPSPLSSTLSRYAAFIPQTMALLVYGGSCTQSQAAASVAAGTISTAIHTSDLNLMASVPIYVLESQVDCGFLYGSGDPLSTVGAAVADDVLPSIHQSGLIELLKEGLGSGYLVPGATPTSVNTTVLVTGFGNASALSSALQFILPFSEASIPSPTGVLGFAGAVTLQSGLVHSSSYVHTARFGQLVDYNQALSFANDSTLSVAGIGVPNEGASSQSSSDLLPEDSLTLYTNNPAAAGSAWGSQATTSLVYSGQSIPSSNIRTTFRGLFPALLSITKSVTEDSNGDETVSVVVRNMDNDSITGVSVSDAGLLSSYGRSIELLSGNPGISQATLGANHVMNISYTVRLAGYGSYVSSPAKVSYVLNGTAFTGQSDQVVFQKSAPNVFEAVYQLLNDVGTSLAGGASLPGSAVGVGALAIFASLAVLVILAGTSEVRAYQKWRKPLPPDPRVEQLGKLLESGLISKADYDEQMKKLGAG